MVIVRRLEKPEEFLEAVEVQREAWRMPDYREAAPAHVLKGIADNGGLVLGAFDEETGRMIGVSYGFVARRDDIGLYFYSHATGVRESSKYRGVGFELKRRQREEVLKMGLNLIEWTFDPLQSLNTYFNLSKLGVIYRRYMRDYYGEIRDSINSGIGTDRVKAEWWIASRRVSDKLEGLLRAPPPGRLVEAGARIVLDLTVEEGIPVPGSPVLNAEDDVVLVALPPSISEVRDASPDTAWRWRLATRMVLEEYLSRGYVAVDFSRIPGERRGYVVLWRAGLDEILGGGVPWR